MGRIHQSSGLLLDRIYSILLCRRQHGDYTPNKFSRWSQYPQKQEIHQEKDTKWNRMKSRQIKLIVTEDIFYLPDIFGCWTKSFVVGVGTFSPYTLFNFFFPLPFAAFCQHAQEPGIWKSLQDSQEIVHQVPTHCQEHLQEGRWDAIAQRGVITSGRLLHVKLPRGWEWQRKTNKFNYPSYQRRSLKIHQVFKPNPAGK